MPTFERHLLEHLRGASHVAVLTGAGVSAESGIATFRDDLTGYWARFDPMDLATPEAFARDPELVSRWYDERRCRIASCQPNPGHFALANLQQTLQSQGKRFTLVTQNVDRLHQLAGSTDVIELHGTLWVWRCLDCDAEAEERGPAFGEYPPGCRCGGQRRPGVVWFGEALPVRAIRQAESAARDCDVFMSLGTSSVVYPAAGLIDIALESGAYVIEVNPKETDFSSRVNASIRGASGVILPSLLQAVRE